MTPVIKLSSPATSQFWEIPVLYEDEHLLAVDKPSGLSGSPDRYDPSRPNLIKLLHAGIAEGKPWARQRSLTYLMNAYRLESDTSGVMLLAKTKPMLVALANLFGSEKPLKRYVTLVQGAPAEPRFVVEARLSSHPARLGEVRIDPRHGKRARTTFEVIEAFSAWTLLHCEPLTDRTHQIRVHLRSIGLPIAGDEVYGGKPLLLSRLKPNYRLKPKHFERPLISRVALHAEALSLSHPAGGQEINITSPWPKDLTVAVKYLRRYGQK